MENTLEWARKCYLCKWHFNEDTHSHMDIPKGTEAKINQEHWGICLYEVYKIDLK